jgi:hypothetical protein
MTKTIKPEGFYLPLLKIFFFSVVIALIAQRKYKHNDMSFPPITPV